MSAQYILPTNSASLACGDARMRESVTFKAVGVLKLAGFLHSSVHD